MKLKKLGATMIALAMLFMLIPISIQAASYPTLDFTDDTDPAYPGESGAGWTWDSGLKTLTLDGFSYMKTDGTDAPALLLPADSTIVLAPGSENDLEAVDGPGIEVYGNLDIEGSGSLTIDSAGNGIRVVGDLAISGITELEIWSERIGMRVGPGQSANTGADGNFTMTGCGDIIINSYSQGIMAIGNLFIDQVDSIKIDTGYGDSTHGYDHGIQTGPGEMLSDIFNEAEVGNAIISNVGTLDIVTGELIYSKGMHIKGDLLLSNVDYVNIEAESTGIRVGPGNSKTTASDGNLEIINSSYVRITAANTTNRGSGSHGIQATGNLTVDSVDMMKIEADRMGMRVGGRINPRQNFEDWSITDAEGYVHLIDSHVEIAASRAGIRSTGTIWTFQSTLDVYGLENNETEAQLFDLVEPIWPDGTPEFGLYASMGDIIIERSDVDVTARSYGLVTGLVCESNYEGKAGGDIILNQSSVKVQVDPEWGLAAIFAGDNLEPEDEGHAQIIMIKSFISVPDEAYIVDVSIVAEIAIGCQSITGDPEIEVITSWDQALNYFEIDPYFYVVYFANDGTGDMAEDGPYTSGEEATILASEFVIEGYTFASWNTAADGSGTEYLPGQEVELSDDLVLYAQYEPILFSVTYDANSGEGELVDEDSPYITGSPVTVLENTFTKADYIFIGWNTAADGSGTSYDPGDTFVIAEDTVLYAQYNPAIPETGNTGSTVISNLLLLTSAVVSLLLINKKQSKLLKFNK